MPATALIIQQPTPPAAQLILLFHGVGSGAPSMRALGERLAATFPQAFVVSVHAPHPSGLGSGREWFSVQGITEDNRAARVAAAMPSFQACVAHWQGVSGVDVAATALVGFSQGGIMALEASKLAEPIAGRILTLGARFAELPQQAPGVAAIHLFHGRADPVMPYSHTVLAAHHLRDLGCDVTAEVLPFIGHEVHPELADALVARLSTHIPRQTWDGAADAIAQEEAAAQAGGLKPAQP